MQGRILSRFPEVKQVFGKAGRAETSTDPAPLSMAETVVTLRPVSEWRTTATWYSAWAPAWILPYFRHITPDHISQDELIDQMNEALRIPGVSNAWTMPIRNRIDMLTTGVRTPVGVKIFGADINVIDKLGHQVEGLLSPLPGTRSAFAERTSGGYFLDVVWNRDKLARYGLSIEDVQMIVTSAIGGENVTTTVEGRERYPVSVRYLQSYRSDPAALSRLQIPIVNGRYVPISELGEVKLASGPSMFRDENGLLSGYVYVDISGRDLGSYVDEAKLTVSRGLKLPPGYSLEWSGQYEAMARVRERLKVIIPVTLCLVMILLWLNTRSMVKTVIIVLAVPFSAVGAIWLLYALGYNMSIGVWVGLIALLGVDAETAVFMLLYLDIAYDHAAREGRLRSLKDLQEAILEGAVKRIRPKFMTVAAMFLGLAPIMWSAGTGADVMKRIAAPMIGGIFTSFLLELVVYPAIYEVWKWHFELKPKLAHS
jgi:Cu(I)/Ag(I) efflux system membrane protein CusA/SilA